MTKTGIVKAALFEALQHMPDVFTNSWQDVTRGGKAYKVIYAFKQYFTDEVVAQLEAVFNTEQEYSAWLSSDMAYVNSSWQADFKDYKQARERLKEIVAALGDFAALTPEEKRIAAAWFVVTPEEINSVLTLDEQLAARAIYNEESRRSRTRRYYTAYELFELALSTPDGVKVINSIMYHNLETLYVKLGFEGKGTFNYKGDEDQASILDFIQSTPGTKFETAGVAQLGLQPLNGLTVQELVDKAVSIIKYGS